MSMTILLFSLFIFVPTWAAVRNFSLSDGYVWGNVDNVTDFCDYECGWMQCGDICINAMAGKCYCGEVMLDLYYAPYHCCVDHSPNRTQCSVDKYGFGHCPQGRLASLRDRCNNHCFNDYDTSQVVGGWSRYRCGDQCVGAVFMCNGYLCTDSRDDSECNEGLKCIQGPYYRHSKGVLVSDLSGGHHYCDYENLHSSEHYDSITREDEDDLNVLSRRVKINYTSITECIDPEFNLPGLICGEICVEHRLWCLEDSTFSCGKYNFSTNNKKLCANTTFWEGKTCDIVNSSGEKAAVGKRCTGATQRCSYPWYTSSIFNYEVSIISLVNETFRIKHCDFFDFRQAKKVWLLVWINLIKCLLCTSPALKRNLSRNIMSQSALEILALMSRFI